MTTSTPRSISRVAVLAAVACVGLMSCAAEKTPKAQGATTDTATTAPDSAGAPDQGTANRTGTEAVSDQADTTAAMFAALDPDGFACSVAVQKGEDLVFAAAYGALDGSASLDISGSDESEWSTNVKTKFDIASTSKQFTGLAVEMLVTDGDIKRTDLVGDLLPKSLPATANVTVGQLLNHTSGLPDYGDLLTQEYDEDATQDETIEAIAASKPATKPGATFEYSNSNYVLLASIVEAVANEPFAKFVQQRIFDPLDLDMVIRPEVASDPVAAFEANIAIGTDWPVKWRQYGDGSVVTTPSELVRWGAQFWEQTLDGPTLAKLGKANSVETEDGDRYGSGLIFGALGDGTAAIYHDGSWGGTVTDWVIVPSEKLSVAVSCNAEDAIAADNPAFDIAETWRE